MIYVLALLISIIAGLRAMTAPTAIAWAAALGWFDLSQPPLAFMGYRCPPRIFTVLATGELISAQLQSTPSRKVPMQFGTRILMGAPRGTTIGAAGDSLVGGLIAGIIGAVIGTCGGAAVRGRLAASFGRDLPSALIEDVVAIGGAFLIVAVVS